MSVREPRDSDLVSHGICEPCLAYFSAQWGGLSVGEYLDRFTFPVLVVTGDRRVVAANQPMADRLGKSERALFGLLGGEAMECAYSRTPEGCGRQLHCHTCTVRLAVSYTWDSGRSLVQVPASLTLTEGNVRFLISTEKRGDTVVVMLEAPGDAGENSASKPR